MHQVQKSNGDCIVDLYDTLHGKRPDFDIFQLSYTFAASDFERLMQFGWEKYNAGILSQHINAERKRLRKVRRQKQFLTIVDSALHLGILDKLKQREFLLAEERIFRFATMRDLGAVADHLFEMNEMNNWAYKLLNGNDDNYHFLLDSPAEFTAVAQYFCKTDETEPFLWLHSYILMIIGCCPKSYLENGIFGKWMRSIFGVFFFANAVGNAHWDTISHLAGYFATTYLFDDIIDDPSYQDEEKEHYFTNVLSLLRNKTSETPEYSQDPIMALSEQAFTGIRDLLDTERLTMVAQSYEAIAQATYIGSGWQYTTPLTGTTLYAIATIKAAYTRIIPAILAGYPIDETFLSHCMKAGLIYQLTDDLRDIYEDLEEQHVTPFNYYCHGCVRQEIHPIQVLCIAVSRLSEEHSAEIPDAYDLWVLRISHALRLFYLKSGRKEMKQIFSDMKFPSDQLTDELAKLGECAEEIIDIEAEASKMYSDIAVSMRGGWTKDPVYGH